MKSIDGCHCIAEQVITKLEFFVVTFQGIGINAIELFFTLLTAHLQSEPAKTLTVSVKVSFGKRSLQIIILVTSFYNIIDVTKPQRYCGINNHS